MPYTQMSVWFILSIIVKNRKWKRSFFILGICYLFFFSNRFIINEVLLALEVAPTPIANLDPDYKVGIVLGGIANSSRMPRDRVYLYRGADRINHAVLLYNKGIIEKILVTGGSGSLIQNDYKEAKSLHFYLLLSGVNDEDILVEAESRNTHENAVLSSRLLKNKNLMNEKHLVITSALHLRRALLCFRKTNLNVEGFSTDFYGSERRFYPHKLLIPDPSAFSDWHLVIREISGLFFYKLAGYI